MNVYDGERMSELLGAHGMTAAADSDDADLVVLNTCHIREKAAEKAYSDVGRLRRDDGSKPLIALAGCVAQAEGAEAKRRSPMIDIVVGPQAYHRLPELVEQAGERRSPGRHRHAGARQVRRVAVAPPREPERVPDRAGRMRQVLHLLRRPLHARRRDLAAVGDILAEAQSLVDARRARDRAARPECERLGGWRARPRRADPCRSPGSMGWNASATPPATRRDMTDELIAAHGEVAKLMPYLHLPVQSGSEPHAQGDEPQPHGRILSAHAREGARRAPRHRAVAETSSSASPARRKRTSRRR